MLPPYYKGYEILERNDAKASRSVLRRERASNRPYLVDHIKYDMVDVLSLSLQFSNLSAAVCFQRSR